LSDGVYILFHFNIVFQTPRDDLYQDCSLNQVANHTFGTVL